MKPTDEERRKVARRLRESRSFAAGYEDRFEEEER